MFNENVFPLFPLSTGENKQVDNRNSPPIKFLPNHHIIIYIYIYRQFRLTEQKDEWIEKGRERKKRNANNQGRRETSN